MAYKKSECVYPDWEGGFIVGKHHFDNDGYCVICGSLREDTIDDIQTKPKDERPDNPDK